MEPATEHGVGTNSPLFSTPPDSNPPPSTSPALESTSPTLTPSLTPTTITSLSSLSCPISLLTKVLVGHSMGGGSVTAALCKFPHKISMAVYLAAYMVQPGSASSPHNSPMHLGEDDIWEYIYGEGVNETPTGVIMKEQFRRHHYYSQSPLEDVTLASKLLRPAAVRAMLGFGKLSPNPAAEKVPRVFIKTAKDNQFSMLRQDRMVENWPPSQVYVLKESDHSPFFSVPTTLFIYLLRAISFLQ
uniref:Pheophorbidase n=1 Tax=Noccaea caerulescens TaxID=107243 RepID=A0A1J3E059_NOCCA